MTSPSERSPVDPPRASGDESADGVAPGEVDEGADHESADDEGDARDAANLAPRRRWPVLVLAAGAWLVAGAFSQVAPRERTVLVRLPNAEDVRRVDVTWFDDEGDVLGAGRYELLPGQPARVEARLRLRRGTSLGVSLLVEAHDGAVRRLERRVTVEDGDVVAIDAP
ncbi:MAG: hypothetical protein FJ096_17900 [Deltaproteobacteria bacterium]|nr:hypothetical protein [Deltaproteobacteria bacterium]